MHEVLLIYRSKYGSAKAYAEMAAERLGGLPAQNSRPQSKPLARRGALRCSAACMPAGFP